VTLVNAASAGDSLVVILFADYQLLDTDALTFTGGTTIEGGLTVDNDGATVLTVDRASTDGAIIDVQKNGSSIGGIGVAATDDVYFAGGTGSTKGIYLNDNGVLPATTGGSASDATVDLGNTVLRWKNLYLSGGVYLGGTGSANKLDDYEEGTWTPTNAGAALTITEAKYTKVGRMVTVACYITADANTSGNWGGLPFSVDATGTYCGSVGYQNDTSGQTWNVIADSGTSWTMRNGTTSEQLLSGKNCRMTLTYFTT